MNIFKDRDFRIAISVSSVILVHLIFSILASISSYFQLKVLVPKQATLNLDFVAIEIIAFVIAAVAIFTTLKIAKMRSLWIKLIIGFIYSILTTYFVVYKFIVYEFYHVNLGGGEWGYLTVILGWPTYLVVSIPILILFYKLMTSTKETKLKIESVLMILPSIIGLVVLIVLTFTGRLIFQKSYEHKKLQISQNIKISNIVINTSNLAFDKDCKCIRPQITGSFETSNNVSFPVILKMNGVKYHYLCRFGQSFEHTLKVGEDVVNFNCFSNERDVNIQEYSVEEFEFTLQEINNAAVVVKK